MAIRYKIDLLSALRDAGYTSYKLRHEKILGESTMTKIRAGKMPSWHELDIICELLQMQPGEILEFVHEDGKKV